MRHRAIVLGTTGALLLLSVVRPTLRPVAVCLGFISMLSCEAIVWLVGGANGELARVAVADWMGIAALTAGVACDRAALRPAAD